MSEEELEQMTRALKEAASKFGLNINEAKTEYFVVTHGQSETAEPSLTTDDTCKRLLNCEDTAAPLGPTPFCSKIRFRAHTHSATLLSPPEKLSQHPSMMNEMLNSGEDIRIMHFTVWHTISL
ncbi:uncharacterized protein LOC124544597 [Schistocerca americana]|uniref:uncharacterized protein LOC124544597 n=1 Tax=Schistocerca americana TaxID=7009 RepID=UPI001F4F44E1|nr:uncharacterized protein LOC124544597 [Schistocerca americana]